MKKLQNNFTTPEQSEKLLAMGIPANTADLYYERYSEIKFERLNIRLNKIELANDFFEKHSLYTPQWTVGRLIEIFVIAMGLDTAYLPIERSEDMVKYLIRLYEEKVKDLDFSKLEE